MKISFKKTFNNEAFNDVSNVPEMVRKAINDSLPNGLEYAYYKDEKGQKKHKIRISSSQISGKFSVSPETLQQLPSKIQNNPDLILEYIYRTQKPIKITDVSVCDQEHSVPIEIIDDDILNPSQQIGEMILYPPEFPQIEPIKISINDENSYEMELDIKRVPYEKLDSIKLETSSIGVIKLIFICPEKISKDNPFKISCSVYPKKANNINEIIKALHIYKGYITDNLMINGAHISGIYASKTDISTDEIDKEIDFWKRLVKLENILSINISPNTEFSLSDQKYYNEFCHCFIEEKPLIYINPFTSFQIPTAEVNNLEEAIETEHSALSFIEKVSGIFMGNQITIYSASLLVNFQIIKIIDNKDDYSTVYIEGSKSNEYKLYKKYEKTEEAAKAIIKQFMENLK